MNVIILQLRSLHYGYTWENILGKSHSSVMNVIILHRVSLLLRFTKRSMHSQNKTGNFLKLRGGTTIFRRWSIGFSPMGKSHSSEINVIILHHKGLLSRITKWHILGKSHSSVMNVVMLIHGSLVSRLTWRHILGKSHSIVMNAIILHLEWAMGENVGWHILGKSHSSVMNVVMLHHRNILLRRTWRNLPILRKSLSSVMNVINLHRGRVISVNIWWYLGNTLHLLKLS